MKVILYSVLLSGLTVSCSDQHSHAVIVDLDINITIENANGEDVLNPAVSGSVTANNISVFYEINGELETYLSLSNGDSDNPSGFTLNPPDGSDTFGGRYFLTIFSNPTEGEPLTIIKVEGMEDINLVTKVVRSNGNTRITEIRYKDELVWPVEGNDMAKYVRVVVD